LHSAYGTDSVYTHHLLYVNPEALHMSNHGVMTHLATTETDKQNNTQNNVLHHRRSINRVKILYLVTQLQTESVNSVNAVRKSIFTSQTKSKHKHGESHQRCIAGCCHLANLIASSQYYCRYNDRLAVSTFPQRSHGNEYRYIATSRQVALLSQRGRAMLRLCQ